MKYPEDGVVADDAVAIVDDTKALQQSSSVSLVWISVYFYKSQLDRATKL